MSMDDFYITDSRLVVLSTTNPIFNASLDQFVTPESLLAWQRFCNRPKIYAKSIFRQAHVIIVAAARYAAHWEVSQPIMN